MYRRHRIVLTVFALAATVPLLAGSLDNAPRLENELPDGLKPWSFLIGKWDLKVTRFSFESEVIEETAGTATFSVAPGGRVIMESQRSVLAGNEMEILQLYIFNPRRDEIEIARTDSGHHAFSVTRGTSSDGRIDLVAKHPNPDSDITRRYSIVRKDSNHFVQQLDFSEDKGKTWFARSRTEYRRAE